jgi:hypothetical protein
VPAEPLVNVQMEAFAMKASPSPALRNAL